MNKIIEFMRDTYKFVCARKPAALLPGFLGATHRCRGLVLENVLDV